VPKLPRPTGKELLDFLMRQGFIVMHIRGSHHVLKRGEQQTTVPIHGKRTVKMGTVRGILRDIEMSPREFMQSWQER